MTQETKYYSDDGRYCSTDQTKVEQYETELKEKQEKRERLAQEKADRKAEIEEAQKNYLDLLEKYIGDYGRISINTKPSKNSIINSLFDLDWGWF